MRFIIQAATAHAVIPGYLPPTGPGSTSPERPPTPRRRPRPG